MPHDANTFIAYRRNTPTVQLQAKCVHSTWYFAETFAAAERRTTLCLDNPLLLRQDALLKQSILVCTSQTNCQEYDAEQKEH